MADTGKMENILDIIFSMRTTTEDYWQTLDDYSIDFAIEYRKQMGQQDEDPDHLVQNIDQLSEDATNLFNETNRVLNELIRSMEAMERFAKDRM